jgi:iron complex outermembrane receptor protein
MHPSKLPILGILLLCSLLSFAQVKTIKGVVRDAKGSPVAGAVVSIKGAAGGTNTNNNGEFSLSASTGDVLTISSVGFKATQVTVGADAFVMVTMETSETTLQDVVLVGTRSSGRSKIETPVPVDIVNMAQAAIPTGRMDVTSILNISVPSFNYNKQSGSDGADHIDLASLRGLSPDQTLVLVNGKRRHQTAFVAVFGTRGRGNTGTDLSAIPTGAIDRVEVLRDGASAQYGSDAIAGVINIITRKSTGKLSGNIGWSGYADSKFNPAYKPELGQYVYNNKIDGGAFNANLNYGFSLGKGFLNLTGNFLSQGKTYRQVLETSSTSKDYLPTNIYRRAHGDGSMSGGGLFLNMELPASANTTFYAFGGFNYKGSDAYAFSRNWSARPDRFPTKLDGSIDYVPSIMRISADADTFYNPRIRTNILDGSLAAGLKGKMGEAWTWDLSNSTGYNNFHFYGNQTFNASLGSAVNSFDDGGFSFLQNTTNLNFSKPIYTIAEGFNLAMGAEYRFERYNLYSGELNSYKNWDPTGNKASGSQGFPGYQPSDEVTANRSVVGAYVDAEMDVSRALLISGAVRAENYSDFGFTANLKLATRLKVSDKLNLRGSFSTGFRAPSLPQINFSSTFTTVQGGKISEVRIVPNYLEITRKAGIPSLKQERSTNASLGFTFRPSSSFTVTLDGYWVNVKDRVVLTGQFDATDPDLNPELAQELQDNNIGLAQFFANAVDTRNMGIDLVLDYSKRWGAKSFRALFTGNFQDMKITKVNVPDELAGSDFLRSSFFSDREKAFVLASAPKMKMALNLEYGMAKWTFGMRATYFGKVTLLGYGEDGLGIDPQVPLDNGNGYVKDEYIYNGKAPVDLYLGYKFSKAMTITFGSDNIFNVHPDLGVAPGATGWAYNTETGGPWDAVQMGGNGRRLFARVSFNF